MVKRSITPMRDQLDTPNPGITIFQRGKLQRIPETQIHHSHSCKTHGVAGFTIDNLELAYQIIST